jgi:hypothetical protein
VGTGTGVVLVLVSSISRSDMGRQNGCSGLSVAGTGLLLSCLNAYLRLFPLRKLMFQGKYYLLFFQVCSLLVSWPLYSSGLFFSS